MKIECGTELKCGEESERHLILLVNIAEAVSFLSQQLSGLVTL